MFRPEKLAALDTAIEEGIRKGQLPGAVLWLESRGQVYTRAYGRRAVVPVAEPALPDTVYDIASLTKVLATAPAMVLLWERGQVDLEAPVTRYLPEFAPGDRGVITVRQLLTHTSGLPSTLSVRPPGYAACVAQACREQATDDPGKVFRYSDVNFILLGELVRRVSGHTLADFAAREFYQPLGMSNTCFLPPPAWRPRIAPTEGEARGVVQDAKARLMGGVAGHAGVFSTASDLARFARMMLREGELDGVRVLAAATVRRMISVQSEPEVKTKRGLGWDIESVYSGPRGKVFPVGSYGHTGWTGPSLWIDPGTQTFVVFLCNRNHPDGRGDVVALRSAIGTLAAEAVGLKPVVLGP